MIKLYHELYRELQDKFNKLTKLFNIILIALKNLKKKLVIQNITKLWYGIAYFLNKPTKTHN